METEASPSNHHADATSPGATSGKDLHRQVRQLSCFFGGACVEKCVLCGIIEGKKRITLSQNNIQFIDLVLSRYLKFYFLYTNFSL